MRRTRLVLLILALSVASGCGSLLPEQATSYYLLRDLRADQAPAAAKPVATAATPPARQPEADRKAGPPPALLISVNPSSTLYENTGIVFSRGPSERAYYQLGSWSERPSRRLGLMVEQRLVKAMAGGLPLSSVALDTSGVRGDWLMGVRLIELYHDTTTQPDQAVVSVEVELIDWDRRRMLDRAVFSATAPLAGEQIDGAVSALNDALTRVLDELEQWLATSVRLHRTASDGPPRRR